MVTLTTAKYVDRHGKVLELLCGRRMRTGNIRNYYVCISLYIYMERERKRVWYTNTYCIPLNLMIGSLSYINRTCGSVCSSSQYNDHTVLRSRIVLHLVVSIFYSITCTT